MADPLSQLRDYATQNRLNEIRQENGLIVFGDYGWPVDTKTLYTIWNSGKEGTARDYYTLETLLFFLLNSGLPHPQYTREAVTRNVLVVRLPDRKDLLAYLRGEIQTCASIDRSAPLEITLQRPVAVRRLQEQQQAQQAAAAAAEAAAAEAEKKRARLAPPEDQQQDQQQQEQEQSETTALEADEPQKGSISPDASKSLLPGAVPDGISADKLAEIIAKRKQRKQTTTTTTTLPPQFFPPSQPVASLPFQSQTDAAGGSVPSLVPSEPSSSSKLASDKLSSVDSLERFPASTADLDLERDVYSRERKWRTRLTLLKAQNSQFADSVFNTLQAIKAQEEGSHHHHHRAPAQTVPQPAPVAAAKPHGLTGYSRYDQEKFGGRHEADDFNINVMSSFASSSLTMLGARGAPGPAAGGAQLGKLSSHGGNSHGSSGGSVASTSAPISPASGASPASADGSRSKKTSRTPIIVIPASESSVITMYNVKELLQDMRFISTDERKNGGMKRDPEVLIQRQKEGALTVPYRVIDSVSRLTAADWDRVVAVFVQGPAWQFKGWPWNGNPTEIFAHVKAFHLKWAELPLDSNVKNWSVNIINLDRYKRHLDRASLQQFWDILDRFMSKQKPHLRF